MPKVKLADKREIFKIPSKEISEERSGSPYLSRVEQQNVRKGELPGSKIKSIEVKRSAIVQPNSGVISLASNGYVTIETDLTANDANVIVAFLETSLFIDIDKNLDNLWPSGATVENEAIVFSTHYDIVNSVYGGLEPNQARASMSLWNVSGGALDFYLYQRWTYFVIEPRAGRTG